MTPRLIIAGGGLAGSLAALSLARRRPDVDFIVIEEGKTFGGSHIWSFFDTDVPANHGWLLDGIVGHSWRDHEIRFPSRERVIGLGYNSVRSRDLDRVMRRELRADQYRLRTAVAELHQDRVILASGEVIEADGVLDARGARKMPGIDLGWQKFVGRVYRYPHGHGRERPTIMDATVSQEDGYRFVYLLPFTETDLLVEDTYYSSSPKLDRAEVGNRVERVASGFGQGPVPVEEEHGVLPVVLGGDVQSLWDEKQAVARLGLGGGFFHPTTGYSLPDAVANAILLSAQADLSTRALFHLFRRRAVALWRERHFFQLLNRMLLRAAQPESRYRILEHFYRLPTPLIGRFYAAKLTSFDKIRILSGRAPVPIRRAISALRNKAA